ncbi:MAG: polyketide cyclase [Alicyclobacillus sp. RIFOXYA1_FULL_53_8]|nr:MAG: polyketide cyclase [Alicyclobacillus sp. RIFOXYA1_FULL_53_8]
MTEAHETNVTRAMEVGERGYVITRILDVPRDLVFQAWTTPEHLSQWWGPKGFTNTFQEFDLKPGGVWRFIMHGPDGVDYPNRITVLEVVPDERIVFEHHGPNFRATATFEDLDGKTRLTYRTLFETTATFDVVKTFAVPGGEQTFDRLEAHLVSQHG